MEIITKQYPAYTFAELSEQAKEKARDWWRSGFEFYWHAETVIDDAADIAELFGLDIRQRRVDTPNHPTHKWGYAPSVYYSGFWSQGDGACFQGVYRYKKGALAAVKAYAPQDTELHRIVAALQSAQRKAFYKLGATTKHRGHYYHSGCMDVDVCHVKDSWRDISSAEDDVKEALRDFADWIYRNLEREHEYQNSDEVVDDTLVANDYRFTEEGEWLT